MRAPSVRHLILVQKMFLNIFLFAATVRGKARKAMPTALVTNDWGSVIDHDGILELRWFSTTATMSDGGFMATLCLFATQAETIRPKALLIDAVEFAHAFGDGVMAWRDAHIIPRYGSAGVRRFAFVMPPG